MQKKQRDVRLSNIRFSILQEILLLQINHHVEYCAINFAKPFFLMSLSSKGRSGNGAELKLFSQIRGLVEQDLGGLLVTSSSSHFSNKADVEQYRFNSAVIFKTKFNT